MHKKIYFGSLLIVAGIIGIWQLANAATTWQGPPTNCTYPGQTDCNTDGVIWNRLNPESAPANTGGFKVQGAAIILNDIKGYNDFYIPDTKSIRVDKAGDSIIRVGNWGGTGQWRSDLVVYGDLKVEQKGTMPALPRIYTPWLCLNGDCRDVWPSGGGGGGTVTSVGSGNGLTGGPITGAGTLAVMTCTNGQVLKTNASNLWYCGTDNDTNSGGTLTGITAGTGISVSGAAPSPTVSINSAYSFGCVNGQVRKWNGSAWVCSSDITGTVGAGTGIIITGTAPNYTVNVDDNRYVNVDGDTMTGTLTLNTAGYPYALTVNGGNGGTAAVYGNNAAASGYGGQFYGAYGIYATTPNNANGYYAGYFNGYSGGVNAIGNMAGGSGILGQNAGTGSYGVKGYAVNGYGGHFMDSTYYSYVGGQGYGLLSNGKVQTSADVQGGRLCIGTDCRDAWPTAGTGDITGVTAGNGLTGGGLSGDVTLNIGAGTGMAVAADTIGLATCANGYVYKSNGTSMTCQPDATGSVSDIWVNTTGDAMSGNLTINSPATLNFGATDRQMINLDGTAHAIGTQTITTYFRSSGGFAWFRNGTHSNTQNSPGTGGTMPMSLSYDGVLNTASSIYSGGSLSVNNALQVYGDTTLSGKATVGTTLTTGSVMRATNAVLLANNATYFSGGTLSGWPRLGMIVESGPTLSMGIPYWGSSEYQVRRYNTDGSSVILWAINNTYGDAFLARGNLTLQNLGGGRGVAYKPGGGSWAATSDFRLKKNIKPISDALTKLEKLNGVEFNWINPQEHGNDNNKQGGFIAQEIEKYFPNWITETSVGGVDQALVGEKAKAINLPYEFDALVVESIKELKAQNEELKAKNQELEARLERLEALIK